MKSFSTLFKAGQKPSVIPILKGLYPFFRFLVRISIFATLFYRLIDMGSQPAPNDAARNMANSVMKRIGTSLVKETKASLVNDKAAKRKDILSLLARANTMETDAQQITDEDIMSRAYKPILN